MEYLFETCKKHKMEDIKVEGIVDGGVVFSQNLSYFNGETIEEKAKDLLKTIELNPPLEMRVVFPDTVIFLVDYNEELIMNIKRNIDKFEDEKSHAQDELWKFEDCLETIQLGKPLDEIQKGFLSQYNL